MRNKRFYTAITDPLDLRELFENKLRAHGLQILGFMEYQFEPQGYTAIWLLAESHLAIHSFPEQGLSYVELSFCNEEKFEEFEQSLRYL